MAGLSGTPANNTYASILNVATDSTAAGLTGSLKTVYDGLGNASALQISTTGVSITGLTINGHTLTLGGNLTTSGAFNSTFTMTNTTAVTFPTSGTLTTTSNNLSVFAATTSAQFAGIISDATGTGSVVLATSPTLTTPIIGVATATTINKVTITQPAASATLTIANTKSLTVSNILTFTGTDSSSVAFGAGGTVVYTGANSTLTNLTGMTGAIQAPTQVNDANGVAVLTFTSNASAVDNWSAVNNVNNSAALQLLSTQTNATGKILAKGTGNIIVGSTGATTTPLVLQQGANQVTLSVPTLTSGRTITIPDQAVTLNTSYSMLNFSSVATVGIADAATTYFALGNQNTTESTVFMYCPFSCVIDNLYTVVSTAASGTRTFTLMNNGVGSALTCVSSAGVTTASDLTHTVTVPAGNTLSMKIVTTGGNTTASYIANMRVRPTGA